VTCLLKSRIVEPEKTPDTTQRLGKHTSGPTKTRNTKIEEILEALFSMWSVQMYIIMRMNLLATQDNAKPDTENIRGLKLAVLKLSTVQVTNLPL
jgi:hypothetical protein